MKTVIIVTVLFMLIVLPMTASCQKIVDIPETPFGAKYAVQQVLLGQGQRVLTTDMLPKEEGGCIRVTNYWWRESDEEGNIEWLRRAEDYYCVFLPVSDGAITVRIIKEGQINEVVHMYEGSENQPE